MKASSLFLRVAAFCALLSALTTLGVHLIPGGEVATTFDERVALRTNPVYLGRLWVVAVHVWLVMISMWGLALVLLPRSAGAAGVGFLGFVLFGFAEWFRTALAIFTLNRGWRAGFAATQDEGVRDSLRTLMEGWPALNGALFVAFLVGFSVGNLGYGLALLPAGDATTRALAGVLLWWSGLTFYGVARTVLSEVPLPAVPEFVSWTFQPAARVFVGLWLWGAARALSTGKTL